FALGAWPEITGNRCQVGILEERLEGTQSSLWLEQAGFLTLPPGRWIVCRASGVKRNRNPSKASTALIITVNRQHKPPGKPAAPDASEPREQTASTRFEGSSPAFCLIGVTHAYRLRSTSTATGE